MTITCKLSALMGERRYTIKQVYEKTGLARTTISNLYHDKTQRVDYDTLEKLCTLFECQPNDILQYIKND